MLDKTTKRMEGKYLYTYSSKMDKGQMVDFTKKPSVKK
jgi:hypothetical protein